MVDFSKMIPRLEKECTDCGRPFKTSREDETRCTECAYYHSHPESAPGYFTWTKTGSEWAAVAKWRDHEHPPDVGTMITVHRKDGTSSEHAIVENLDNRYSTSGDRLMTCRVSR